MTSEEKGINAKAQMTQRGYEERDTMLLIEKISLIKRGDALSDFVRTLLSIASQLFWCKAHQSIRTECAPYS